MNTLTIAVLLVCATMAYASALPDSGDILGKEAEPVAEVPAEELLQGEEARYYGGGGYNRGWGGGGGYRGWGGGGGYRGWGGGGGGRGYYYRRG